MSIREAFVLAFGEEQAHCLEVAATEHQNGINGTLASHDGDFDYLAATCGSYDEFLPGAGSARDAD